MSSWLANWLVDQQISFMPEIDLNPCGDVSQRVSRRHAQITWQNGKPFVEDVGSGFGTRLHGTVLPLGETRPLLPGDHIWLAGCVLAYDIEVPETPKQTNKRTGHVHHSQITQVGQVQLPV